MCLTAKTKKVSIAEDDIVCYKVVMLCSDGEFSTPLQKAVIPKDIISGKSPFFASGDKEITYYQFIGLYSIGQGFIHTYENFESAFNFCKNKENLENLKKFSNYCIFECDIPKGTKYYKGHDDYGEISFASEKIMFKIKIV